MPNLLTPGQYSLRDLTDNNYVYQTDLIKPSWNPKTVQRFGTQRYLSVSLDVIGMSTEIDSTIHNWTERDRIMRKIVCTTAGAAANTVATFSVVTGLTPPQQQVNSQNPPYVGSATYVNGFTVRKDDIIPVPPTSGVNASTLVRVKVLSVNPQNATFTATPLDITQATPAVASATQLPVMGGAFGEKSQNPDPIDFRNNNFSNDMHIHRQMYKATRTSTVVTVWATSTGAKEWTADGEMDTYKVFLNEIDMLSMYSNSITNPLASDPTNPTSTTVGVVPQVLAEGWTQTYNTPTGVTVNDWLTFIDGIEINKGAREYLCLMSGPFLRKAQKNLSDYLKNGSITYGNFTNDEAKRISLDFKSFSDGGYTFNWKNFDLYNDYQTFAAPSMPFNNEALFLPISGIEAGGVKSFSVVMAYMRGARLTTSMLNNLIQSQSGEDSIQFNYLSQFMCNVQAAGQAAYWLAS